jgi:hypothetical protein
MARKRMGISTLLFCAVTLLAATAGWTQGFGNISGTVVDANQVAVSAMSVRAVDAIDPTRIYTAVTTTTGQFTLDSVPVGTYHVFPRTAGTTWVIKDATPIVDVVADQTADVSIGLVKMHELAPDSDGGFDMENGGGGSDNTLMMVATGLAAVGAGGSLAAYKKASDNSDDIEDIEGNVDKKLQDNLAATVAANDTLQQGVNDSLNNFKQEVTDRLDRVEGKVDHNARLIDGARQQIFENGRKIDQLSPN